jgi:hypothetical protein
MRAAGRVLALALLAVSAIAAVVAPAFAAEVPETVVIGLDLSQSNPLVKDDAYAARVGARTAQELLALPLKSRVMVRTFGSYDGSENGLKVDQVISAHAKPQSVAEGVAELIAHVPALVRAGKLKSQGMTNIVPFLDTMAEVVDCKASDVRVILVTDGFEDSEYAHLTRHGGHLPAPAAANYEACDGLTILGLGQGSGSPSATVHLRKEWKAYAGKAGFRRFTGLYDW